MRSNDDGYSLLETLIAFAIMALVLSALLPGQAQLLGRTASTETKILAKDYAYSVLDTMGISRPISLGSFQETYRDWNVEIQTTPTLKTIGKSNALEINISIYNNSSVTLATVTKVVISDD